MHGYNLITVHKTRNLWKHCWQWFGWHERRYTAAQKHGKQPLQSKSDSTTWWRIAHGIFMHRMKEYLYENFICRFLKIMAIHSASAWSDDMQSSITCFAFNVRQIFHIVQLTVFVRAQLKMRTRCNCVVERWKHVCWRTLSHKNAELGDEMNCRMV